MLLKRRDFAKDGWIFIIIFDFAIQSAPMSRSETRMELTFYSIAKWRKVENYILCKQIEEFDGFGRI
jgi:hypothetical protein